MQISNNTTKDKNMDKDYYKTKGVFETKGDHMDEAEDFLDAISDIGLLDLEVSNDFTYVGHAEVGLKCIKKIPKTKDSGVEKLFQIQFCYGIKKFRIFFHPLQKRFFNRLYRYRPNCPRTI